MYRRVSSGAYVLGEALGRGGSSTVFRARRRGDAIDVAAKLIPVADADSAQQVLRHYQNLASLTHSNLIAILDVGAGEADAEVDPAGADLQAVLAAGGRAFDLGHLHLGRVVARLRQHHGLLGLLHGRR